MKVPTPLCISVLLLSLCGNSSAIEASFTPAPDKDTGSTDGPLPQSQNQRNQLLQLDQMIAQSPNPQETLQKVAESNNISAEELGSLLMRNRRDMQMANGGGGGVGGGGGGLADSLPRKMIRLLNTLFLLGFKSASAHPRSASIMALLFLSTTYVLISVPRSGIVLSSRNGLLSSGHTTFLSPPAKYLSKYVSRVPYASSLPKDVKAGTLSRLFADEDEISGDEGSGTTQDGVHVRKLTKSEKKKLSFAATARKEIPFAILVPSEEELTLMHEDKISKVGDDEQSMEDVLEIIENEAWDHAVELAFTSACRILSKRRYSEYIATPSNRLRIYSQPSSGTRNDVAALVMKSMGDCNRFGIQPLRLCSEYDSDNEKTVGYYTLKGGQFDGELKFSINRIHGDDDDEPRLVVSVTLLIPSRGRKIKSRLASKMLALLSESIATSSITEAKQILSRELQSTIYRGRAKTRAAEKRHTAYENMRKMEEMAEERRRRRQRSNPNTGRYRPTGISRPGGGPSRSF